MSGDKVSLNASMSSVPVPVPSRASASAREAAERKAQNRPAEAANKPTDIEAVASRLESYLRSVGRAIEFRVDNGSGRTIISVRDAETGELIRQIPSEDALRLAEMADDQTIVLIDEKA